MSERVDHPDHYEKSCNGFKRPECIDLLEVLTEGFPGILALDIGQLKYLYRFGSKSENGMSRTEKAVEDLQKVLWYANDFKKRKNRYDVRFSDDPIITGSKETVENMITEEFVFDKPTSVQYLVRDIINSVWNMKRRYSYMDEYIDMYIDNIEALIKQVEKLKDEDWD